MNPPVKPIQPEAPVKTFQRQKEIARYDYFPFKLINFVPDGAIIDLEYADGDDYYSRGEPSIVIYVEEIVDNPNYDEEARKFDLVWASYLKKMEDFKTEMKAWKANEDNRKDQIKANKNRIKQLQDEIERLKKS